MTGDFGKQFYIETVCPTGVHILIGKATDKGFETDFISFEDIMDKDDLYQILETLSEELSRQD